MAVVTNSQIKALEKVRESPGGLKSFNMMHKQAQNHRLDQESKRTLYSTKNVKDITVKTSGTTRINETIETRSINYIQH